MGEGGNPSGCASFTWLRKTTSSSGQILSICVFIYMCVCMQFLDNPFYFFFFAIHILVWLATSDLFLIPYGCNLLFLNPSDMVGLLNYVSLLGRCYFVTKYHLMWAKKKKP